MGEDREHGFRDEAGAAMERAARLQEENDQLKAELAEARAAKTEERPPSPPGPPPSKDPGARRALALALGAAGLVFGTSFLALTLGGQRHAVGPPKVIELPRVTAGSPLPPISVPSPVRTPAPARFMPAVVTSAPPAGPNEKVIEVRSLPAGADVAVAGKPAGRTPTFVRVSARSAGACTGNTCTGGICTGGTCELLTPVTLTYGGRTVTLALGRSSATLASHDFLFDQAERPDAP